MSERPEWDDLPGGDEPLPRAPAPAKGAPRPITRDIARQFLEHLADGHSARQAAAMLGVRRQGMYELRERWPEFAEAWVLANEIGVEALEDAAFKRAVHGVPRKVFYQGEHIDTVHEYSDTLLVTLLRAKAPERYRERYDVQQHVNVTVDYAEEIFAARKRAGLTIDATPTSVTRTHQSDLKGTDDA